MTIIGTRRSVIRTFTGTANTFMAVSCNVISLCWLLETGRGRDGWLARETADSVEISFSILHRDRA